MRLADSLPRESLERLARLREAWWSDHPEPRTEEDERAYVRLSAAHLEHWLDAGAGECILRDLRARRVVEDGMLYARTTVAATCSMPPWSCRTTSMCC